MYDYEMHSSASSSYVCEHARHPALVASLVFLSVLLLAAYSSSVFFCVCRSICLFFALFVCVCLYACMYVCVYICGCVSSLWALLGPSPSSPPLLFFSSFACACRHGWLRLLFSFLFPIRYHLVLFCLAVCLWFFFSPLLSVSLLVFCSACCLRCLAWLGLHACILRSWVSKEKEKGGKWLDCEAGTRRPLLPFRKGRKNEEELKRKKIVDDDHRWSKALLKRRGGN
mmetsp:Transcript_1265/g.2615  ORF Transcript_1265/g.2615 Transcript_1265/m.2615 type:complete len:227 (+) Transcript_1265:1048-1728(+)